MAPRDALLVSINEVDKGGSIVHVRDVETAQGAKLLVLKSDGTARLDANGVRVLRDTLSAWLGEGKPLTALLDGLVGEGDVLTLEHLVGGGWKADGRSGETLRAAIAEVAKARHAQAAAEAAAARAEAADHIATAEAAEAVCERLKRLRMVP